MGRKWDDKEIAILKNNYNRHGGAKVRKMLQRYGSERSVVAIHNKASELMVWRDGPEGCVSVRRFVHDQRPELNLDYYRVAFEACKDGVLVDFKSHYARYYVPVDWAEQWLEKYRKGKTNLS